MNDLPQPSSSAHQAVLAELKKPGSLALLFMATALTVVSNFNLPDTKIPLIWLVTVLILWIAYGWIVNSALRSELATSAKLSGAAITLIGEKNAELPKVVKAMQGHVPEEEIILLLRPNKLFGQSMVVSIYFEDERGFELLVAEGAVGNIQMNGSIQIVIKNWQDAHIDVKKRIIEQNVDTIDRLIVKPAATTAFPEKEENSAVIRLLLARINQEQDDD